MVIAVACLSESSADPGAWVIGIYVDDGAHPSCVSHATEMFTWMGFGIREIDADDVNRGSLEGLAAVYFPGGDSPPYINDLSPAGKQGLIAAVERGMAYIGTCAGSMFAAETQVAEGERYRDGQLGIFRGDAVGPAPGICGDEWCYTMLSSNPDHAVSEGEVFAFEVLWYNSPFFWADPAVETHVLASYVATGAPAFVAQQRGDGRVLLTGPHPEFAGEQTWAFVKDCILWSLGLPIEEEI